MMCIASAVFKGNVTKCWKASLVILMAFIMSASGWSGIASSAAAANAATDKHKSDKPRKAATEAQVRAAGSYLADAGDCHACHTRPGGQAYAGGLPIKTPFGTVYTPNITPDRETGIGDWSDDDFYRAMHRGRDPQGNPYYPVFPYTFFTKVTKEDVLSIKAFLFSLKPVRYTPPSNQMAWPYSYKPLLDVWQQLFFHEGTFQPDSTRSSVFNRGAYLVQGLGHCGACHTPRNWLGATERDAALTGAHIDGWFAPNVSSDLQSTIRDMSVGDITTFLRTGASKPKGPGFGPGTAALGPMATVVHESLSHLNDQDLTAIATYLKGRPASAKAEQNLQGVSGSGLTEGAKIFAAKCSVCHGQHGNGNPPYFPALKGNPIVNLADPTDVLRTILYGAPQSSTQRYSPYATMPPFGSLLNDGEVAAVTTYVRSHWGNNAPPIEPADVKAFRQ